ncbi:hypothetical protein BCR39DRAFT_518730 [Naematelia encephala]|uniref:Uncharacterized protein n=1 Tax=Naematelia encephala TaxID=71784 RepID=A0A1Y2BGK2_9TREE|nr:hypothetical protein BCR39DRAFT_518730 [Naematelia encephala]
MQFSTRNAFYLRVSNYRVIPLFLYLDERHVDWMEDRVLQLVMSELQSKLPPLLTNSRNEKKHKVHVERGEGYQYCYFLRTTTRTEVVLLKNKSYSLRPPTPPPESTPLREQTPKRSRTRSTSTTTRPRSTPTKRARSSRSTSVRSDVESIGSPPLVSEEVQVKDEREETPEVEERGIKDWKPDVNVTFKGFGTSSVQLVLIIEPYPPLPPSEYAPPSSRLSSRSTSIAASRSRSRHFSGTGARSSSTSLSVAPGNSGSRPQSHTPNMRNASRSVSALPRGTSSTPFGREDSSTPGPGGTSGSRRRRASQTPLFIRDLTVDDDEEDEEQHQLYTQALREGRLRLPSVSRPAGIDMGETTSQGRRSVRRGIGLDDDDEDEDDMPETLEAMSQRLVRSSEIEEGVTRVQGGWEERAAGEESAVMGREEPGD